VGVPTSIELLGVFSWVVLGRFGQEFISRLDKKSTEEAISVLYKVSRIMTMDLFVDLLLALQQA